MNTGLMTIPKPSNVFGLETSVVNLSMVMTNIQAQSGVSSVGVKVYFLHP